MTLMNRLFELFQRRDHEAGQVVVLVTGGMLTLLASVGIVLDVGIQVEQRRQLQNAVDAAAHAGAQMLPDTTAASARAQQYFDANTPTEGTPTLSISFPTPDREQIEIVGSLEVQYVVLSLFGKDSGSVSARAVAGAQATDIVLALDRSGSMCRDSHWLTSNCPAPPPDHEPMTSVKAAANGFAELFESGYARIGLVSFATTASMDIGVSSDFGAGSGLETTVNDIYPSGSTNIGDALHEAIDEVRNGTNTRSDAIKVIVLLSDGVPNRCGGGAACDSGAAANHAEAKALEAAAHGITVYTIGLGNNIDEALMQRLADIGGGAYIPSPTAADLDDAFDTIAAMIKVSILE